MFMAMSVSRTRSDIASSAASASVWASFFTESSALTSAVCSPSLMFSSFAPSYERIRSVTSNLRRLSRSERYSFAFFDCTSSVFSRSVSSAIMSERRSRFSSVDFSFLSLSYFL